MTFDEITKTIDGGKRLAVRCNTERKAVEFLAMCKEIGYKWKSEQELVGEFDGYNGHWNCYKKDTVYFMNFCFKNRITYADVEYCKNEGVPFVDYEIEEIPLAKSDYDISFIIDI